MAITVTMIEEKEFKTKVRGYDPVEVDEFLDEICDEMIEMQGTIQTLRDQLKQKAAEYTASSFAPLPVAPLAPAPAPRSSAPAAPGSPIARPLTAVAIAVRPARRRRARIAATWNAATDQL